MCFGGGSPPSPPPLPKPPPKIEPPKQPVRKSFQQSAGDNANRQTDKRVAAYQSGRKKTMLSGPRGDQSAATLGTSTLLGA